MSTCYVPTKKIQQLTYAQRERLAYIDFALAFLGQVTRTELIQKFKTGLAAGTRDLTAYKELAPNNMVLEHSTKLYLRTPEFEPLFEHDPQQVLVNLANDYDHTTSHSKHLTSACFDAIPLIHPSANFVSTIMRAIYQRKAFKCNYVSLSSGETTRILVPHSVVNNGHRWHVRAYDRHSAEFRDFVCTRFTQTEVIDEPIQVSETRESDKQWNRIVDVSLIVHPNIKHVKAIELDYGMVSGELKLEVRAALLGYLLNQWKVDCSPSHSLNSSEYQLALRNHQTLYGVENLSLLPGYTQHDKVLS